jgi:DNA-binding NtrC family response regulator
MHEGKTVLYLDDNEDHRDLLKFIFEDAGYRVLTCSNVKDCLDCLTENEISVIVMDYWLEGRETVAIGERIKELYPQIPFFFFTGDAQSKSREKGIQSGARAYFVKPDDLENIVPTVGRFL